MKLRLTAYDLLLTTFLLGFSLILSGCVVRSYSVTKDRVDQDLEIGNRGYLSGEGLGAEDVAERKTTRTTQVVEIELHPPIKFETAPKTRISETTKGPKEKTEDNELWGNRGYITRGTVTQSMGLPTVVTEATDSKKYVVQKGDTLQKISQKFFGTTKKWPKLYDANKDVLKGPNKLYPGQVLTIPFDYAAPSVKKEVMAETEENLK